MIDTGQVSPTAPEHHKARLESQLDSRPLLPLWMKHSQASRAALGTHGAACMQEILCHCRRWHSHLAGVVKGKEWQGDEFSRERGGGETHITKVPMINGSKMRGKFTYALGEEVRMFTSFLHDKCKQETERKELLISGTNNFFSPQEKLVQVNPSRWLSPACPLQRVAQQAPLLPLMSQRPLSSAPPSSSHTKWKRILKTAYE